MPPAPEPTGATTRPDLWRPPIDADRLREFLPHRWPFLFLDRVTHLDPGRSGIGVKNVSVSEPYFAGHFPHESVMPGVIIIESLAQLAGLVVASDRGTNGSGRSYLAAVNRMRFRTPVRPGDQLMLSADVKLPRTNLTELHVEARVGGASVANGRLIVTS